MLNISKKELLILKIAYYLITIISIWEFVFFKNIGLGYQIKENFAYNAILMWIFFFISVMIVVLEFVSIKFISQLDYKVTIRLGWSICFIIGIDFINFLISFIPTIIPVVFPFYAIIFGSIVSINFYLYISNHRFNAKIELIIRKSILDLGTQYSRLELKDISEKCGINQAQVENVLEKMILNQEIYAKYSEKSNKIKFDQNSNLDEIDNLMQIYEKWENEIFAKKLD